MPNQYSNYKTTIVNKPIDKVKGSVVLFDDMLGARNRSQLDEFFTRGRHKNLGIYCISQSYFGLTRQSIRNNSDKIIPFKQSLRDAQSIYRDTGAHDMLYSDFKQMYREAWSEKFNYLCIDTTNK